MNCTLDRDCPQNEVCYLTPSSSSSSNQNNNNSNNNPREGVCGCHLYFGWKRNEITKECSDLGIVTYIGIAIICASILLQIVVFLITVVDLNRLRFVGAVKSTMTTVTISFFGIFGFLGGIGSALFLIDLMTPVYSPVKYVSATDTSSEKTGIYEIYASTIHGLSICFGAAGILNIPLFWLELIDSHSVVTMNMKKYTKIFITLDVLFLGVIVPAIIFGFAMISLVLNLGLTLVIIVLYCFAYKKIRGELSKQSFDSQLSSKVESYLNEMHTCMVRVFVTEFLVFTTLIAFAILSSFGRTIEISSRPIPSFSMTIVKCTIFFSVLTVYWGSIYLHPRIREMVQQKIKLKTSSNEVKNLPDLGKNSGQVIPKSELP